MWDGHCQRLREAEGLGRRGGLGKGEPKGSWEPQRRQWTQGLGQFIVQRSRAEGEGRTAASPTPQRHTHSSPWAMVLGVTHRG